MFNNFGFKPSYGQISCLVSTTKNLLKAYFRYPDRQRFESVCKEPFQFLYQTSTSTSPNPASVYPQHPVLQYVTVSPTCPLLVRLPLSSSVVTPMKPCVLSTIATEQHTKHLRADEVTPRKARLRQRLSFLSKTGSDEKKKRHLATVRSLTQQFRLIPNKVKCLNKCLRKRKSMIHTLKQRLLQTRSTKAEKEVRILMKKQRTDKTKLKMLENQLIHMDREMKQKKPQVIT